jgi:Tol biopolymer transport system component
MSYWIRMTLAAIALAGCAGEKIDVHADEPVAPSPDAGLDASADVGAPDVPVLPSPKDAGVCGVDGWIVFDSDRDAFKRGIFAVRADGTRLTRLTNGAAFEQEPAIAPDGVRLAYASDAGGTSQIYVVDLVTRNITKVTSRADGADQPAWSPDGKLLAFHSGPSVVTIRPDGTDETVMVTGEDNPMCVCSYVHPAFAPDGLSVVADRSNQIEAIDLVTKARTFLIGNGPWAARMPAFTSDGHTMAFVGDCGVTVTPLKTPDYCKLKIAPRGSRPSFGPGNALAYEEGSPAEIYVTTSGCQEPINVTNHAADDRNARWAPPAFKGAEGVPPPK